MTSRSLWLAGALALVGCTSSSEIDGPIDFRSANGLAGTGDGIPAVHIELDGTMTRTPVAGAPEIVQLDAAAVARLHASIEAADLPSLSDYYRCDCADDTTNVVSVQIGGSVHTVSADSHATPPAAFARAVADLRALSVPMTE